MLRYFIVRHDLAEIQTPNATAFKIRSAAPYNGKVIPFSHIYVTSDPYSRRIKKSLGKDADKFEELNPNQKSALLKNDKYPINIKGLGFKTVTDLRQKVTQSVSEKNSIEILVVNGIGTGFGDNYVGLGAMQRLANLLAPNKVNFHLMQTMNKRAAPVYMREKNVFLHNNCMPVSELFKKDFILNLTGMLGFPEFDSLPLARFQAQAFSIDKLVPISSLHPKLSLDSGKVISIKKAIENKFRNERKTVLFHPKASSPIRTMDSGKATQIVAALIAQKYNVVSAFPYDNPTPGFENLSELSRSVDDLVHIIEACDAVVSVGTVVYHLAAALNKPTILLPTVHADVESGALLPEILAWLPAQNKPLILKLHKSREEDDIEHASKIWQNVEPKALVTALRNHAAGFTPYAISAPAKVGVVIPHFGEQEKLTRCLDALVKVKGFDPAYLYVVNNNVQNRYFTVGVNTGIQQALGDGCGFVWILNNDTEAKPDYLNATLARFAQNQKIGIVGGKNLKTENPDRIFWGGSYNAFPNGQHKAGYVSRNSLNNASKESWATFSSVIIRAETLKDVGLLDPNMRMIFSDSDYCFSAARKNWETWYEPNAEILHDCGVSNTGGNETLKEIFRADKRIFFQKWRQITGCDKPEHLQEAIWLMIGFIKDW